MLPYFCHKLVHMVQIKLKTNLSCRHCVMKVEPTLKAEQGIVSYSIDLENPDKTITIESDGANIDQLIQNFKKAGYLAEVMG